MTVWRRICARTRCEGKSPAVRQPLSALQGGEGGARAKGVGGGGGYRRALWNPPPHPSPLRPRGRRGSSLQPVLVLDDLPECVFVDDLVAFEAVDVAALVIQLLAVAALAAHGPQRDRPVTGQDVFLILPAHVGDLPEPVGEGLADCRLALQRAPDRLGPARQAERRILREAIDDALDIAAVERGRDRSHQFDRHHPGPPSISSSATHPPIVIPAKAGIHQAAPETVPTWIPAFAGMTS